MMFSVGICFRALKRSPAVVVECPYVIGLVGSYYLAACVVWMARTILYQDISLYRFPVY
jgi:hypothetical protein